MIITDIKHANEQLLESTFKKAVEFLQQPDLEAIADGIIELDGKRIYASVQSYETFPLNQPYKFEAHQKYIDVQYIIDGEESIGWAPAADISYNTEYDIENDIRFGSVAEDLTQTVQLRKGQFAILFPSDGHAPRHSINKPTYVKKVVVKVAV
ncbi:MAG: YhcH/YjgK/YiaL family protein [Deltaproteobacteria bacterium]|nr:YhcH/YjgK/YiaL family protein [Deltaproteobacteria bacterium]